MRMPETLRKTRTFIAAATVWVIGYAREAATTLAGLLMLTAGSMSMANNHFWPAIALVGIGVIIIDNARDRAVERARYEAFKEGILSLLKNNGAQITVTYHDSGATISIPKGDAA